MNDNKYRIIIIWLYDKYTVCWRSLLSIYIPSVRSTRNGSCINRGRSVCVCVCVGWGGGGGGGGGWGGGGEEDTEEDDRKKDEKE